MRASLLMALRRRLVASLHLRDSSTASKVLVLVSIDNLQRVYDTDSGIAVQQVDPIKCSFTLHVNHVTEVPTHKEINAVYRARGDMPGIVLVFWRDNTLGKIGYREMIYFLGDV
jgi:hypothetical protein